MRLLSWENLDFFFPNMPVSHITRHLSLNSVVIHSECRTNLMFTCRFHKKSWMLSWREVTLSHVGLNLKTFLQTKKMKTGLVFNRDTINYFIFFI